jgi:hypothetical protein
MRHDQVAARQQQRLRHVAFDPDIRRLRPEIRRVDAAPHRDDDPAGEAVAHRPVLALGIEIQ